MQTLHGDGQLYSGDRAIGNIHYVIRDTTTGRPFEGDISGTFTLADPQPHPLHRPRLETPSTSIRLDDGRKLDIMIDEAPTFGSAPYHFQGIGRLTRTS